LDKLLPLVSSMGGAAGGESAMPTTKSGRVKKNKMASNIPRSERKVAVKKVTWYGTL